MAQIDDLGWLTRLLTTLVKAVKDTFTDDYPIDDFRDLWADTEYPNDMQNYPGVWVDFEPTDQLQIAGIDHKEYVTDEDGELREVRRWTFAGYATFTIGAMSSMQRARLVDEFIKVIAFGQVEVDRGAFRQVIEDNDYLAMGFDWDAIGIVGKSETPRTPWGTDEVIYEITVRMECLGEFVSLPGDKKLVRLSAIQPIAYATIEEDPSLEPPLSLETTSWR